MRTYPDLVEIHKHLGAFLKLMEATPGIHLKVGNGVEVKPMKNAIAYWESAVPDSPIHFIINSK